MSDTQSRNRQILHTTKLDDIQMMYSYYEKSKVKVLSLRSSFRNGIWLQTGLWRSMTEVLTSQLCNIRYRVPTFPISDHKQTKKVIVIICVVCGQGFCFCCFLEPMLFGWASLCSGLLDDAEIVVQGGGRNNRQIFKSVCSKTPNNNNPY
jgi:hypothetical protein